MLYLLNNLGVVNKILLLQWRIPSLVYASVVVSQPSENLFPKVPHESSLGKADIKMHIILHSINP